MSFDISVPFKIPEERVQDLLITATEGGIGYWCQITSYACSEGKTTKDYTYPHFEVIMDGGRMQITEFEEDDQPKHWIDRTSLTLGLQRLASTRPEDWKDFMKENEDICTADIFIQLAVFNEIKYG